MKVRTIEDAENILVKINENNAFIAGEEEDLYYLSFNDLKDNNKEFVLIGSKDNQVMYFNHGHELLEAVEELDLDFVEQGKGE